MTFPSNYGYLLYRLYVIISINFIVLFCTISFSY